MSILDLLFPKHCISCRRGGSYVCSDCFTYISFQEHGTCILCQKPAFGGLTHPRCRSRYTIDGVFSSLVYKGIVKKLVYNFKYNPYLTGLQPMIVDLFYEGLIQKELFYPLLQVDSALVPIPLHPTRMKMRGYNQSRLMAEGLSDKFHLPLVDGLKRIKKTHTQVGLSQVERVSNMKGAFTVKKELLAGCKQVFLVDDVMTSGATLHEAAKMLKKVGVAKVWGITLAHGD